MHRHLRNILIDLALISLATVSAAILRDNLEIVPQRMQGLAPYLGMTLAAAVPVIVALGIHRSIWRLTTINDYGRAGVSVVIIVLIAIALGFISNRLDDIPRSLPILQANLMLFLMVGARVLVRQSHAPRRKAPVLAVMPTAEAAGDTVLVIGLNRITELYLAAIAEFAADRIEIAGLLGTNDRHTGRLVQQQQVLGAPEEIKDVLKMLGVHGVFVDRIVITASFASLPPQAQADLLEIERTSNIKLELFAEWTRLDVKAPHGDAADRATAALTSVFTFSAEDLEALKRRPYWRVKRAVDFVCAACLSVILAPVIALVAGLAAIDLGRDISFWQLRPGLGGQRFKLHKFRTMAPAHDGSGRRLSDDERLSAIGRFLRRTRLDELPQLYNILMGHMSFVGPRPLLPVDQPAAYGARLLVRPGLTGWAQVKGGRTISPADKAALDVWYVQNASLKLDLKILAHTAPMVLLGETVSREDIRRAWRELREAGICTAGETRDASARAGATIEQAA
jgi:lipopolysaccharide/colanic/teichoic acid biosynthesis glycosyltransferase